MNITKIAFLLCTLLWGFGVQAQSDSVDVVVPETKVDSKSESNKKEKVKKKAKKAKPVKKSKSEVKEESRKVKQKEKLNSDNLHSHLLCLISGGLKSDKQSLNL